MASAVFRIWYPLYLLLCVFGILCIWYLGRLPRYWAVNIISNFPPDFALTITITMTRISFQTYKEESHHLCICICICISFISHFRTTRRTATTSGAWSIIPRYFYQMLLNFHWIWWKGFFIYILNTDAKFTVTLNEVWRQEIDWLSPRCSPRIRCSQQGNCIFISCSATI